ncbi:hypothetical protein IGI57_000885 [Enterococcus sp. DIV0213j]
MTDTYKYIDKFTVETIFKDFYFFNVGYETCLSRAIIKCWFWAIEIVGSFLFIVSFLFLSFHYNFSFDRKVL